MAADDSGGVESAGMSNLEELSREVAALRVRVEATEAVQAIQNLKARYAQLVDQRYVRGKVAPDEKVAAVAEQIAALFSEDGVWDGGPALGVSTGRAEIAARMRAPTLQFSWHFFLKSQIHVDGDRASARWDILSPCTTKDGNPTGWWASRTTSTGAWTESGSTRA